eukprot:GHUV01026652.1.p1 GENE.GHUV01026652.1~~GHUV01026652.1.p1  ORF type:complete len:233 (+),score=38.99 GHUV01026652.1:349-1047(+)
MPKRITVALDPAQLEEPVTWEGWGTSLAWFAVALRNHEQLRRHISTLLFSRDPSAGLGMNIVRYNIGGACQDQAHEYRTGAAVPCLRRPDGSYDWNADSSQVAMLLAAAQEGADTFEAFINSPPWFWTESGNSRGHDLPLVNNLKKQHIDEFAAFCAGRRGHQATRVLVLVTTYVCHKLTHAGNGATLSFALDCVDHRITVIYVHLVIAGVRSMHHAACYSCWEQHFAGNIM